MLDDRAHVAGGQLVRPRRAVLAVAVRALEDVPAEVGAPAPARRPAARSRSPRSHSGPRRRSPGRRSGGRRRSGTGCAGPSTRRWARPRRTGCRPGRAPRRAARPGAAACPAGCRRSGRCPAGRRRRPRRRCRRRASRRARRRAGRRCGSGTGRARWRPGCAGVAGSATSGSVALRRNSSMTMSPARCGRGLARGVVGVEAAAGGVVRREGDGQQPALVLAPVARLDQVADVQEGPGPQGPVDQQPHRAGALHHEDLVDVARWRDDVHRAVEVADLGQRRGRLGGGRRERAQADDHRAGEQREDQGGPAHRRDASGNHYARRATRSRAAAGARGPRGSAAGRGTPATRPWPTPSTPPASRGAGSPGCGASRRSSARRWRSRRSRAGRSPRWR